MSGSRQQGSSPFLVREVRKSFRTATGETIEALKQVSFEIPAGKLTALVGPDGAGKTTLLRLAAGLLAADSGEIRVLDFDVRREAAVIQARIGYMPQRFGLYEDLTVQENLDLYASLHGVSQADRGPRYRRLLGMTALTPFVDRLAGQLSGGMKQKLGLACTLVRSPELLLLDEPTVGVDPLSRCELWEIIPQLAAEQGLSILLSTAYLDEADRCEHAVVLHEGRLLAEGRPAEVRRHAEGATFLLAPSPGQNARTLQSALLDDPGVIDAVPEGGQVRFIVKPDRGRQMPAAVRNGAPRAVAARFEDGFMALLRHAMPEHRLPPPIVLQQRPGAGQHLETDDAVHPLEAEGRTVVEVHNLVRQFGDFTAVDRVNFQVHAGEIFGLLGPNGAGKTTTFRMLCGLLAATSGTLRVGGMDLRTARASARQRIGYVAQKFSLYGQLTVRENLDFFASAYALRADHKRARIEWALRQFELEHLADTASEQLPGGFKRRLAIAAALLHEPSTLFLDEPTSGADPFARREFWRGITALALQGVTVVVTTHFMEEAEYCDHVAILDQGKVLASGTPAEIRRVGLKDDELARASSGGGSSANGTSAGGMEEAFIRIVEAARRKHPQQPAAKELAA